MSNISINSNHPITDGMKFSFRTPCNCTEVDGLIIKYRDDENNEVSKTFIFADTHGKNISGLGNLFEVGVMVEVILDVTNGKAFLVNSATNSYLEDKTNIPNASYKVVDLSLLDFEKEVNDETVTIEPKHIDLGETGIVKVFISGHIRFKTTAVWGVYCPTIKVDGEIIATKTDENDQMYYEYAGDVHESIEFITSTSNTTVTFETLCKVEKKSGLMTGEDKQKLDDLGVSVASKGCTFEWKNVNEVIPIEPGCIYDLKGDNMFNWYLDEACTIPIYDNDNNLLLEFKEAILFASSNDRGDGLSQHHVLIFSKQTVKGYSETGEEKDVQTKTFTTKMFTTPYGSNFYIKSSDGTISIWKVKP